MSLKTKVLVVRTITVVLALVVVGFVIATFENPETSKWISLGSMTCVILAIINESLTKKMKMK